MLGIDDIHLPGLADLSEDQLRSLTGADEVDLLRLRYRAGKRAILHIATRSDGQSTEGTVWFFKGDKAARLARRNKTTARFDPKAQALFEAFPNDHRMPQIQAFLADYPDVMAELTGALASAPPVLLRYRPGLSCTFRCALANRSPAFVKVVNDDDPARLLSANRAMQTALRGQDVSVATASGISSAIGAIAYDTAPGAPLDQVLQRADSLDPVHRAIAALCSFRTAPILPDRHMGPDALLARAGESADFIAVTAPGCAAAASRIVSRLKSTLPNAPLAPIHGDMKLEHLFLTRDHATLIDTESVSLGMPDYDLAQLYGRLWQAELDGLLPRQRVQAAASLVRHYAGPHFEWCLDVVAVRLAKYYAQRPSPDMARSITCILDRLT